MSKPQRICLVTFLFSFSFHSLWVNVFPFKHFVKVQMSGSKPVCCWKFLSYKHSVHMGHSFDDSWKTWWCPLSESQMNSPNGRLTNKFEDEVPFSPEITYHQPEPTLVDAHGSHSGELQAAHHETLGGNIYRSIRVVVFSNRLNFLMPFGPVAIVVHKLSGHHHVSCSSCNYSPSCIFSWISYIDLLRWIAGLGLRSEFIGYNASGGAVRLCYRVIFTCTLNLKILLFKFSLFMVSDATLFLVLYRQLAFFTGDTGNVII